MKRQLRTKCNFRYRLLSYLDSLSFRYPQEQNRPEKFSTGESQVLLGEKKKFFLSRGFVERRVRIPKSLNASLLLDYRRTPRELQPSTSYPKKSIHILFGRIRYLIISSKQECDQIYLCDIIIAFWKCVSYSEIWDVICQFIVLRNIL